MQLLDLAVPPWPSKETGLKFGLGPTFLFPTATSKFAGQGAWQAGPAFAVVHTGVPRMLIGFLLQNPISFAYTLPDRLPQNTLRSNRWCSSLSGMAGIYDPQMQHGCMGGSVIPHLCCR
jgi:hypothetical protein